MKSAITAFILLICVASAVAAPFPETDVPELLQPWIEWVRHGVTDEACPLVYNDPSRTICDWPSPLRLNVKERRTDFSQTWTVHASKRWIFLPGDNRLWPQAVTVNGKEYQVGNRRGRPAVFMAAPGKYQLHGRFDYDHIPEWIQVPVHTGRVQLSVEGQDVDFPRLERNGRLLLRRDESAIEEKQPEDRLQIQVHRLVEDDIPLRLITRLDLVVSGKHRHVRLGQAATRHFIPMQLTSPLPARIESDGTLLMQVRPGRWSIEITARHVGPVNELSSDMAGRFDADHEIWAFADRRHLRLVTVQGVPQVDARQTSLPGKWAHLPAYLMKSDTVMRLEEQQRGDPEPAPDQINLDRSLWLDFDGRGYSVRDRITGAMTTGWRLEAGPPIIPGRITISGQEQLITRLEESSPGVGVEVRYGRLDLVAESRIDSPRTLPATGWNRDFQSVKGTLHLPPGWTLLDASGIDNIRHTWLKQWSLLNLFLMLVVAVAAARLYRWYWGLAALATMMLITHEPGAPAWIWLHLLAAVALLRVVPEGKIGFLLNSYRLGCVAVLIAISVPFMVIQVRNGLYPQMERSWQTMDESRTGTVPEKMVAGRMRSEAAMPQAAVPRMMMTEADTEMPEEAMPSPALEPDRKIRVERLDVNARVQTGPGIPGWQWRQVPFSWNGPVGEDESISFVLLSPGVNLVLAITRTALLALLIWGLSGLRFSKGSLPDASGRAPGGFPAASKMKGVTGLTAMTVAMAVCLLLPAVSAAQPVFPPEPFLKELKSRLTEKEPPACAPDCATIPRMDIVVKDNRLTVRVEVHSLYDQVAVPLPASINQWVPRAILMDGRPVEALYHDPATGHLWLSLSEGVHQLDLSGDLPPVNTVQLPLPLKPRHVTATVDGWTIDGLHADGLADDQLQLDRIRQETTDAVTAIEPERLPPLLEITRVFHLGLTWHMETTARRLTPVGSAVVMSVPLLPGESVTSETPVADGRVLINLGPRQQQVGWLSELDKTDQLKLQAADTRDWTEVWRVDVAPVWHADIEGIPVIQHQDQQGNWLPEWRPWPGETIVIRISRPQGVEGQTFTVENSRLIARPGPRLTGAELQLEITSSRGSQHEILLPEKAELQSVLINERTQPIRQEGRSVTLPLTPGKQQIKMTWRQQVNMDRHWQTPRVDLQIPSVNAFTTVHMPQNRWVLFCAGPRLGPAVLFWSLVLVIALLSLGLGQISATPLRFHHWFLLGLGLTQASLLMALPVAAWFLALGYRRLIAERLSGLPFNLLQLSLLVLTAAAAAALLSGIKHGLLGYPDMHIAGNGSSNYLLHWYQDRAGAVLPRAGVISLPLMVYRILILAWALWLAFAAIKWLRWGWECWSADGWWRPVRFRRAKAEEPSTAMDDDINNHS